MSFFSRLVEGNKKTKKTFAEKLKYIFTGNDIDEDFYEELEYVCVSSDIGSEVTTQLIAKLKVAAKKNKLKTCEQCKKLFKEILTDILNENLPTKITYPCVMLVVGVNGVGKTTTIGKLAQKFDAAGKNVILAAADTFRAAAGEQLEVWAKRTKVKLVGSQAGADPASVAFDGISSAKARKADVLIIDTAGRLHNKVNLMEELKKINRVIEREYPEADYHKLIVIDGTTGQNAINQMELFNQAVGLTDVAITKLDGTSKGGFIFALSSKFNLPIRYIGVGETADDLLDFDSKDFVNSIIDD